MGMVDWFRRFGSQRLTYGLMHPTVWQAYPGLAQLAVKVGAIRANPKMAIAALQRGACVLVYPGGAQDAFRPHSQRHQIQFCGRKGFIKLALREGVPIIPLISVGAHDTLFVVGDFYQQAKQLHEWGMPWLLGIDPEVFPVYCGLPWGLAIGPLLNFPLPMPIHTRVCKPIVFERQGREAASDRVYVNACYDRVCQEMQEALERLSKE
jgi:1-acyl-sn-glycerol-3-phosphate acyltransferase